MKSKLTMSITIRLEREMYEQIEELKWNERVKQSELLRELIQIGLEASISGKEDK